MYGSWTCKAPATTIPSGGIVTIDASPAGKDSEPASYLFTFPLVRKPFLLSSGRLTRSTRIKGLTRTLVPLPVCNRIHCFQHEGLPCLLLAGFPGQPKLCSPKGRTLLQLLGSAVLIFSPSTATNTETWNSFLRKKMLRKIIHFGAAP